MHALAKVDTSVRREDEADISASSEKYLSFMLGGELYGFPIIEIKEIIEFGHVTRVPMGPPHVRGVTNLRGNVVPVVCLAARLGRKPMQTSKRTCILVMEVPYEERHLDVGVVIDSVTAVFGLRSTEIEAAPTFGGSIRGDFIRGMANMGGTFVTLLHGARVLSIEELSTVGFSTIATKESCQK